MMSGIEKFREEAMAIKDIYPTLSFQEEQGQPLLAGTVLLKEGDLNIDEYKIEIKPTDQYPNRFPLVFEKGERIPINIDWHVYPNGHCCIKALPEEILICKQGITLESFIYGQVIPYFFNQKYRELHGFFLHERKHGVPGNLQFFEDTFKTTDLKVIARGLLLLWEENVPNRVSQCFCRSGLKYRHCHKNALNNFKVYTKSELEMFLSMIKAML